MKISIHTFIWNGEKYQYCWKEAVASFLAFADEVVVVDGNSTDGTLEILRDWEKREPKLKVFVMPFPYDYVVEDLAKHYNYGFEQCTGDIIINFDADYILHEKDHADYRVMFNNMLDKKKEVASFVKCSVMNITGFTRKSEVPRIIAKGSKCRYGLSDKDKSDGTDTIIPDVYENYSAKGKLFNDVFRTGQDVYCYDYFFRTIEVSKELLNRTGKSSKVYGWYNKGNTPWKSFLGQTLKRLNVDLLPLNHSKFVKDKVEKITPDLYGFNNWGLPKTYEKLKNLN